MYSRWRKTINVILRYCFELSTIECSFKGISAWYEISTSQQSTVFGWKYSRDYSAASYTPLGKRFPPPDRTTTRRIKISCQQICNIRKYTRTVKKIDFKLSCRKIYRRKSMISIVIGIISTFIEAQRNWFYISKWIVDAVQTK